MANHNLPQTTSTYQNFVTELDARLDDLALGLDPARSTMTNLPTNSVGWSSAENKWKRWDGTAWQNLATTYAISISGSAATLTTARTINTVSFNGSANIVVEPYVERDDSTNASRYITFVDSLTAGHQRLNMDTNLSYNPSTNVLTVGSITGNAATVTNGVYTTGDQTIAGNKTFSSTILGSVSGNAGTVTNGVYTTGDQTIAGNKTFSGTTTVGNMTATGTISTANLTVVGTTSSQITLGDSDEGNRILHNNSNQIGFLTQAGGWGAFCDDDGNWTAVGNVTAYSDERIKKDWTNLEYSKFILDLSKVKYGTYTRIDTGERQVGVSAQSLQKVLPEAVLEDSDGLLKVSYGNAALTACIALAKEVVELRKRITELEAK